MNIRSKLTFSFTTIVAAIILFLSIAIYYFSSSYRQSEFYVRLKNRGINTAKLFIEVNEVDSTLLTIIDKNTRSVLPDESVAVFDQQNKLLYHYEDSAFIKMPDHLLEDIRYNKEIRYHDKNKEAIGFVYYAKNGDYVVIASAFDQFGLSKLANLRLILIIGLLFSITATIIAGWIFASHALKPVARIANEASLINFSNLKMRINEGNKKDELAMLAITFNDMLNRLDKSFELQRSFVSNASHELRTPLTAIRGQIEVSLLNERSTEEYKAIHISILDDISNLITLSNNLLELARTNSNEWQNKNFMSRIDEQLFIARDELLVNYPHFKVNISFPSFPETEQHLISSGNDILLKRAFFNIMENACKYSENKSVHIQFQHFSNQIIIDFIDTGIGIPQNEIDSVLEPFYRASNSMEKTGHGLGLALTSKIIELCRGKLKITSQIEYGTTVRISLPTIPL